MGVNAVLVLNSNLFPYLNFLIDKEYVSNNNGRIIKDWISEFFKLPPCSFDIHKDTHIFKVYENLSILQIEDIKSWANQYYGNHEASIYSILVISKLNVIDKGRFENFFNLIEGLDTEYNTSKNRYSLLDLAFKEVEKKKGISVIPIKT